MMGLFFFLAVMYQKRFKKERKARMRLQHQYETELKRRSQMEDALKASGAPAEAIRLISGEFHFNNIFYLFFVYCFLFI